MPKTAPPNLVTLTDKALKTLKHLFEDEVQEHPENQGLRLSVNMGGCSGLSYKLAFDAMQDSDYVLDADGVAVLMDPKSAIYLKGITLDYQGGLDGRGFVFINPNATDTCSCGESFNVS
jgi:iron-sulfur cluster assembly protein